MNKTSSFSTNRLLLVPLSLADRDTIYSIFNNPAILNSYDSRPIPQKEDTASFIERITLNGNLVWTIRLEKDKEKIIGICALHDWDTSERTVEIGGTLLPNFWGKGLMYEAFTVLINFAVKSQRVNAIIGKTLAKNKQAIRLIEKLGFNSISASEYEVIMRRSL